MKKFKLALLTAAAVLPMLQSCNDSPDPVYQAYVTVNTTDANDYYFTLDDGKTLYPEQKMFPYNPVDADGNSKNGKRAVIIFDFLNKTVATGYDHSIVLYEVGDVLTTSVETAGNTAEADEKFGNRAIKIRASGLNDKWLTLNYAYPYDADANYHRISLVNNLQAPLPDDMPKDYTYLEFRHNEENSSPSKNLYLANLIAFDLGALHPAVTRKKGLYIAVIHADDAPTYVKVDYKSE